MDNELHEYLKRFGVEHCLRAGQIERASQLLFKIEHELTSDERKRQHGLVADAMLKYLGLENNQENDKS